MENTLIFVDLPAHFSFKATVYSHGWCELPPFSLDEENWRLNYVFRAPSGQVIPAVISEENDRLRIRLAWVRERRAGRLLRSPTVFEDLVKTICTTNCSWSLTKKMVSNLVDTLGSKSDAFTRSFTRRAMGAGETPEGVTPTYSAFPTPYEMAAVDADFYRKQIRAGYRSPYLVELAERVASGKLDPEVWLTSELPTPEVKKEMKKVKGVGDYAAENLLKLVGRYDGLALDSWLRSQFYKNHNNEKVCADRKIERHYRKFGQWRGLVIWCDMTEKWIS